VAERRLVFLPAFLDDLRAWIEREPRVARRVVDLVEAVRRDPFSGIGKPERLRHERANVWSRRVTQEHRLVYQVFEDRVEFDRCRGHYR
jgi:toxin YoeB